MVSDRPADDLAGEHVEHGCAVDLALTGGVFGDVGAPQPVRRVGNEPPPDKVVMRGRQPFPAALAAVTDTDQPSAAHQSGDPLAPAPQTQAKTQLGVHPGRSIGATGGGERGPDLIFQVRVGDQPRRRRPAAPFVVSRPGHPQHPAGHRDIDPVVGELTDQPEHYFGFGSTFSRAK